MPATRKQMKVAGRELRMRREGKVIQERSRKEAKRPMGAMSTKNLRAYASWPDPEDQRRHAQAELSNRKLGAKPEEGRAFGNAKAETVRFYANASDAAIRRRNGQR